MLCYEAVIFFFHNIIRDLERVLYKIQTEAGHCFGLAQFRFSLSGASQALMSMQSGGPASNRPPISVVGSVTTTPPPPSLAEWFSLMVDSDSLSLSLSVTNPICALHGSNMLCGVILEPLVKPQIKSVSPVYTKVLHAKSHSSG